MVHDCHDKKSTYECTIFFNLRKFKIITCYYCKRINIRIQKHFNPNKTSLFIHFGNDCGGYSQKQTIMAGIIMELEIYWISCISHSMGIMMVNNDVNLHPKWFRVGYRPFVLHVPSDCFLEQPVFCTLIIHGKVN